MDTDLSVEKSADREIFLPAGRGERKVRSWGLTRNRAGVDRSVDDEGAGASNVCPDIMGVLLRRYGGCSRIRKLGISAWLVAADYTKGSIERQA
jgi:hypothetical protein